MGLRGPISEEHHLQAIDDDGRPLHVPDLPHKKWLAPTRADWERYWTSAIAQHLEPADEIAVERYFEYLDDWRRKRRVLKKQGSITGGSQGQPVSSPLVGEIAKLEGFLRELGDRLGMTPLYRARLGLTAAAGRLAVEQLNQAVRRQVAIEDGSDDDILEGWTAAQGQEE